MDTLDLGPLTTAEKISLQELVSAAKDAHLTPYEVATVAGRVTLCLNIRDMFVSDSLELMSRASTIITALKAATTALVIFGARARNGQLLETMCGYGVVRVSPDGTFSWS